MIISKTNFNLLSANILFGVLAFFFQNFVFSQQIFYQDIVRGGITGAGFSTSPGYGSGQFDVYIESGSTIKKAFLFTQRIGHSDTGYVTLNGIPYKFNYTNMVSEEYDLIYSGMSAIHAIDITDDINPSLLTYNVSIGPSIPTDSCQSNCIFGPIYLLIVYENLSMPKSAISVMLNTQRMIDNEYYEFLDLYPIDSNEPVGFSILTDRLSIFTQDHSNVFLNANLLGLVGGPDINNIGGSGVQGDFYYQNNTLYGLSDDTPDAAMIDSDALADVSTLIPFLSTSINFQFNWQSPGPVNRYNIYSAFFLTYTTTCDTFTVSLLTEDTTICKGDSIQFFASGADSYEWSPSIGLSCDDCANPKISPSQSTTYFLTTTKYGNCKKTQPIKIKVIDKPVINSFVLVVDICGENSGEVTNINASGVAPFSYSLNGNTGVNFSDLQSGFYNLNVTDANGCVDDSLLFIESIIAAQANYTADPYLGFVPLEVDFTDGSSNANNWIWYINNDTLANQNPNYTFDSIGTYFITQIAYNNFPWCADTTRGTIKVFQPVSIFIPNIITPNNDAINDEFTIKLEGGEYIQWHILNRWGQEVHLAEKFIDTQEAEYNLWNGIHIYTNQPVSDGVYFYRIIVKSPVGTTEIFTGSLTVAGGN